MDILQPCFLNLTFVLPYSLRRLFDGVVYLIENGLRVPLLCT